MSDVARLWERFEPPSGVRAEFIGGEWHLLTMDFTASPPRYEETGKGIFGQPVPLGVADEAGGLVLETLAWHAYPAKDAG
jgi:hypothetical protein